MRVQRRDRYGLPVAKVLISAAALVGPVGAFIADWNETHVFNPAWPPHAKFHNAQTITSAVQLAAVSLWTLWGPGSTTRSDLRWATLAASGFWLSQAPAILYPGTALVDPDNPQQPFVKFGIPVNQVTLTAAVLAPLLGSGYALGRRHVDGGVSRCR